MRYSEYLGRMAGWALAPVVALGSALRRSRLFHPEGLVFFAKVTAAARDDELRASAQRLEGNALIRFSSAWWKHGRQLPDVLGCAIRFTRATRIGTEPVSGDQDLLLATIRSPWTMLLAPLSTNQYDFLGNDYYGVSPFELEGAGIYKLRLRPLGPRSARRPRDRDQSLLESVVRQRARFILEGRASKTRNASWRPIASIVLLNQLAVSQEALCFNPFRGGRGIHPRGFVHHLRPATYGAGQRIRRRSQARTRGRRAA